MGADEETGLVTGEQKEYTCKPLATILYLPFAILLLVCHIHSTNHKRSHTSQATLFLRYRHLNNTTRFCSLEQKVCFLDSAFPLLCKALAWAGLSAFPSINPAKPTGHPRNVLIYTSEAREHCVSQTSLPHSHDPVLQNPVTLQRTRPGHAGHSQRTASA